MGAAKNNGASQGALDNLREVDDELDEDRYDSNQMDIINDLNSRQINVKNFDLGTPA